MRFLSLLILLLLAPSALAQSAEGILTDALDRYTTEMADIQNYTLTQEVMGSSVTTYAEREDGAGPLDYTSYMVTPNGLQRIDDDAGSSPNPYAMMKRISDEATYAGTETVDGTETHVIAVEDFGAIAREFGAVPQQAQGEFDIETGTFYIGTNDGRIHRMKMEGQMTNDGRTTPIELDTRLLDYRTVDGFTTPFRMVIEMQGMEGQMSAEERAETEQQLKQAREQMDAMPAAQRQMMEKMMGGQLEKLEEMLGGGGFEMEMNVTDLKVNTGRPN